MGFATPDSIKQLSALMDQMDEPLRITFQNVHQGYKNETLARFLRAREGNVSKSHKMLMDCLNWRIENEIDNILSKPIVPADLYRSVRDSQLIGLSGYSREGLPVFALGVGLSSLDKASVHYYVQSHIQINEYRDRIVLPGACDKFGKKVVSCLKILDMTGLKLSALSQIKLMTMISTVDDLNYPEKTETYYIVNAPYIFSACWKVVKPLLQERTRKKVKVLQGCGRDELLKIMDYDQLPHFCKFDKSGSGSARYSSSSDDSSDNCFSLDHWFHQQLYDFMKQQASNLSPTGPIKQGSFHVGVPGPDPDGPETQIVKTIESEMYKFADGNVNGVTRSVSGLKINGD